MHGSVRTILAVAASVAVLAGAGCASLGGLEPPDVTLVDLDLADATLFETSLRATVRIVNPNPEPLEVDGLAVRLYLGGLKVGKAVSPARVTVPRLGSVTVPLDLFVNNVALATRLKPLLETRSLAWAMKGKLYVVTEWGTRSAPLASEGVLSLGERSGETPPTLSPENPPVAGGGDA